VGAPLMARNPLRTRDSCGVDFSNTNPIQHPNPFQLTSEPQARDGKVNSPDTHPLLALSRETAPGKTRVPAYFFSR